MKTAGVKGYRAWTSLVHVDQDVEQDVEQDMVISELVAESIEKEISAHSVLLSMRDNILPQLILIRIQVLPK